VIALSSLNADPAVAIGTQLLQLNRMPSAALLRQGTVDLAALLASA